MLRIGVTSKTCLNWLAYVAHARFWPQLDLDCEIYSCTTMEEGKELLLGGRLDLLTQMMDSPLMSYMQGEPIRIIAAVIKSGIGHIIGASATRDLASLKGGVIAGIDGYLGSSVLVRTALARAGLAEGMYTIATTGGSPERYQALRDEMADAAYLSPPYDLLALNEGYRNLADFGRDFPTYPLTLNTTANFLNGNRAIMKELLQGLVQANRWLVDKKNQEEAIRILALYTATPGELASQTYDALANTNFLPEDCQVSRSTLETVLAILQEAGITPNKPDLVSKVLVTDLLEEAITQLASDQ